MRKIAIQIRNLGKNYRIFSQAGKNNYREFSLKEDLTSLIKGNFFRGRRETHWVLKDISVDIHQGDIVGVVGTNGAGKSTLLKLVAGIIEPTEGRIDIYGRVGALLEVGSGLHGDLSGRENIFLGGAILGMSRRDISKRFDEIVSFAEVGSYLEMPLKRYSSGMYLRLAFSIVAMAHIETEILILDEILAVGDAVFQQKCLDMMKKLASEGRTILFVSHNQESVESFCNRALLLQNGRLIHDGTPKQILKQYEYLITNS